MRFVVLLLACAGMARAEPPGSAIDWLTDIIDDPPNFVITPPHETQPNPNAASSEISLDLISRDAAGLLPPTVTGFSSNIWQGVSAERAMQLLTDHNPRGVVGLHSLFRQVLLAQSDPPDGANAVFSPLIARLDRLISIGALEEAGVLITLAGVNEPSIFIRWFEISLLASRTNAVCNALRRAPALSDDIATRVICLARNGDWNAAAITLSLAASLGDVSRTKELMLIRFLDPELFDGEQDPDIPVPLSPVDFFLREAMGMQRPASGLPLAYLTVDLGLRTPPRLRIKAAERLVKSAAIPPTLLFAAYRAGRAASSGGIWGRAEAIQQLDKALINNDDIELSQAIEQAYVAFSDVNLLPALANEYADQLAHYPASDGLEGVSLRVQRLLLLSGTLTAPWSDMPTDPEIDFARLLVGQEDLSGLTTSTDPVILAIIQAFMTTGQSATLTSQAEAILLATDFLAEGRDGDPADITSGLRLLIRHGLQDHARHIALQILLIDQEAA